MSRPSTSALAVAIVGGVLNVAVVVALYARANYPALDSVGGTGTLVLTGFALGFVATLVTAHTRLLTPVVGFCSVLVATAYLELTTPLPEWSELNGHVIVEGPTHVSSYANTWYVWVALLLYAGVLEFGIRRGYGVGPRQLRNLPPIPLSRYSIGWVVTGFAGYLGVATMLLVVRSGISPGVAAIVVGIVTAAVAAVPLVALLTNGILLPTVLFAVFVPYMLSVDVFLTPDSPVHILLFGPYAIVLAVAWGLEALLRSRLWGWDGGEFTAPPAR